jgi:hypothetical protein
MELELLEQLELMEVDYPVEHQEATELPTQVTVETSETQVELDILEWEVLPVQLQVALVAQLEQPEQPEQLEQLEQLD